MKNQEELLDLLGSIRNKVEIAAILINMNKDNLVPTVLEELRQDSQKLIDGWCIRED